MFNNNNNRRNTFEFKPQSERNKKQAFLCGIMAILSLLIRTWIFALIFGICSGFNVWFYFRNKKREEDMKRIKGEFDDDDGGFDEDGIDLFASRGRRKYSVPNSATRIPRKERKAKYKQFLNDVENELGDFDVDDDENDGGDD